jgi:hypothetical protein
MNGNEKGEAFGKMAVSHGIDPGPNALPLQERAQSIDDINIYGVSECPLFNLRRNAV